MAVSSQASKYLLYSIFTGSRQNSRTTGQGSSAHQLIQSGLLIDFPARGTSFSQVCVVGISGSLQACYSLRFRRTASLLRLAFQLASVLPICLLLLLFQRIWKSLIGIKTSCPNRKPSCGLCSPPVVRCGSPLLGWCH